MNILRIIGYLIVGLLLVTCKQEVAEAPPPIPAEDLRIILAEILIMEPAGKEVPYADQDSVYRLVYDRILEQHGYTLSEFTASMRWLQRKPGRQADEYELILERVDDY